ncbi:MAG: AraC family transcriptional regulator [Anaerolineales bacterium]
MATMLPRLLMPPHAEWYASVRQARAFMDEHFAEPLDLDVICREAHFSRYHFIRLFRSAFGVTPHQYLTQKRIEKAKQLLAADQLNVTDVCLAVGFQSLGSFSTLFQRNVGRSPQQFRLLMFARRKFIPQCFLTMAGIEPGTR